MQRKIYFLKLGIISALTVLFLGATTFFTLKRVNVYSALEVGQKIDSLNGVYIYHNGGVDNVVGRNLTEDGYNLGLKYQCVEFVKRYYFEHLDHLMPNSYGHAKDFYDASLEDGQINRDRNLIQFTNPSSTKPQMNDLLIFSPTTFNQYGHVAIISKVDGDEIEIIQQNAGAFSSSREKFPISLKDGKWEIEDSDIAGWLRKE